MRNKIAAMRKKKSIRQCELAKAVGVTPGAISQFEKGTSQPSVKTLVAIAKALGCKVDDLIDNEG